MHRSNKISDRQPRRLLSAGPSNPEGTSEDHLKEFLKLYTRLHTDSICAQRVDPSNLVAWVFVDGVWQVHRGIEPQEDNNSWCQVYLTATLGLDPVQYERAKRELFTSNDGLTGVYRHKNLPAHALVYRPSRGLSTASVAAITAGSAAAVAGVGGLVWKQFLKNKNQYAALSTDAKSLHHSAFGDKLPINPAVPTEHLAIEEPATEHLAPEEPATEHLAIEEPATEHLVVEEPATEHLVVDEPAANNPAAHTEHSSESKLADVKPHSSESEHEPLGPQPEQEGNLDSTKKKVSKQSVESTLSHFINSLMKYAWSFRDVWPESVSDEENLESQRLRKLFSQKLPDIVKSDAWKEHKSDVTKYVKEQGILALDNVLCAVTLYDLITTSLNMNILPRALLNELYDKAQSIVEPFESAFSAINVAYKDHGMYGQLMEFYIDRQLPKYCALLLQRLDDERPTFEPLLERIYQRLINWNTRLQEYPSSANKLTGRINKLILLLERISALDYLQMSEKTAIETIKHFIATPSAPNPDDALIGFAETFSPTDEVRIAFLNRVEQLGKDAQAGVDEVRGQRD